VKLSLERLKTKQSYNPQKENRIALGPPCPSSFFLSIEEERWPLKSYSKINLDLDLDLERKS